MSTAMVGTETVGVVPSQRSGAKILDNWMNVLFLYEEPNRLGRTVYNVRLIFGNLPAWRYGPYKTEEEARTEFSSLSDYLEPRIEDLCTEAGNHISACANQEY